MDNWIPKNKIVKLSAAVGLLGILLYLGGLIVVLGKIKKVENLYTNTGSEAFKEEKLLAIKLMADTNQETIKTLRNFFIQKGDEVKFIERIESTARNSGIEFSISSIDVETSGEASSFKEDVKVKMNIEGSWKNIMSFVDRLEKLPFGVSVKNLNLDVPSGGGWSGFIEFIIFREK